jgi:putative hydrolase
MSVPFPTLDRGSDLHVHSTFSDGKSTPEENLVSAAEHGLHTIGMVDHVRRDTTYLPDFAAAVRALDGTAGLKVLLGVEAKVLDTDGTVDVPADMPSLDYVLVADHQVPRPDGPAHPRDVKAAIEAHELTAEEVVADLVEATVNSLGCYDRVILAHVFSILPKVGLHEDDVPEALVRRLGQAAAAADVTVEVNEKWTCPSLRVVRLFAGDGVRITLSTDAHHEQRVGRYDYVAGVAEQLEAGEVPAGTTSRG